MVEEAVRPLLDSLGESDIPAWRNRECILCMCVVVVAVLQVYMLN